MQAIIVVFDIGHEMQHKFVIAVYPYFIEKASHLPLLNPIVSMNALEQPRKYCNHALNPVDSPLSSDPLFADRLETALRVRQSMHQRPRACGAHMLD